MLKQPHILVADDDPDIREIVKILLQGAGFRVSTTKTSDGVLELARSERFDLFLLDYWMPGLNGIEVCRRIRTFDKSTPILMCSGAITAADREAVMLAGAQGLIGKPFKSKDLISAVRSIVSASDIDK